MINTERLLTLFAQRYGTGGTAYFAPGRINLIGEHTDYNGGFVFPAAIDCGITAVIAPRGDGCIALYAADLDKECRFTLDDEEGPSDLDFRYVYGVVRELRAAGVGVGAFSAVYAGDVPMGAGMSSSAALECCFAYALDNLCRGGLDRMTLAKIGQATEHKYVGVKCGLMDQFASMYGKEGALMRLDCCSGEFRYFPWKADGYRLLLVNSCVKHQLVGSPYNERRESCERVAAMAGVATLRDCLPEKLESVGSQLCDVDYRRARYVLEEEKRVMAVSDALERGDIEEVGRQMYLTHEGLSRDYEVSCEELDFLVDEARKAGVSGARMMGGGFGGCTINLMREEFCNAFIGQVKSSYRDRFGIECIPIPVVIGAGAREIEN